MIAVRNFDVVTDINPDLTAQEYKDRTIHVYSEGSSLEQVQNFFYGGFDLIAVDVSIKRLFDRLQQIERRYQFRIIIHEEFRKPPFFWRRPWIEIDPREFRYGSFTVNISIPYPAWEYLLL